MFEPIILGIYGESNTGKTTLITKLVSHLTNKGYNIATIKCSKKPILMDIVDKDTWKHHHSGANLVVFSSLCETNFLLNKSMNVSEIIQKISKFGYYDLILVEGANDPKIPKIQLGTAKKRSNTIASYKKNINEILPIIKKELKKKPSCQQVTILINGKNIPLTEFPEKIITHTIIGMLGSLKGVSRINNVIIELKL